MTRGIIIILFGASACLSCHAQRAAHEIVAAIIGSDDFSDGLLEEFDSLSLQEKIDSIEFILDRNYEDEVRIPVLVSSAYALARAYRVDMEGATDEQEALVTSRLIAMTERMGPGNRQMGMIYMRPIVNQEIYEYAGAILERNENALDSLVAQGLRELYEGAPNVDVGLELEGSFSGVGKSVDMNPRAAVDSGVDKDSAVSKNEYSKDSIRSEWYVAFLVVVLAILGYCNRRKAG